jgi:hypothetical protein
MRGRVFVQEKFTCSSVCVCVCDKFTCLLALQEEAAAAEAAERAAREEEEASKWMGMMSVDKQGTGGY